MKNNTLGQLIDNGLLDNVGHIVVDDKTFCHTWDVQDGGCLVLLFDEDSFASFRLDSEVEVNGLDLLIVEDSTKEEQVLSFVKFIYIDPEKFVTKN